MQHTSVAPDHGLEFIAGALCLDFANTVGGTHEAPTHDHVRSYADLVAFAQAAGTVTPMLAQRLLAESAHRPRVAADTYRRGIELREAVWRGFSALAAGRQPAARDLDLIGRETAEAHAHARVVRTSDGFDWAWPDDDVSLARPLWAVARSATELLTDRGARDRLRECASQTCAWVFLDRSRNRTRRWCDMNDCGNRAKQRRFQQRRARGARAVR
jgi:predicted RNA-binding Zn ribbon-like protein